MLIPFGSRLMDLGVDLLARAAHESAGSLSGMYLIENIDECPTRLTDSGSWNRENPDLDPARGERGPFIEFERPIFFESAKDDRRVVSHEFAPFYQAGAEFSLDAAPCPFEYCTLHFGRITRRVLHLGCLPALS